VSKITAPFSITPQPIATARCFKGMPANARAAQEALIAQGRS